jgi:phosphatidylglycerol:prolipoprotein diacylglycerol transferase
MSNAQVAALGSVVVGAVLIALSKAKNVQWAPELAGDPRT